MRANVGDMVEIREGFPSEDCHVDFVIAGSKGIVIEASTSLDDQRHQEVFIKFETGGCLECREHFSCEWGIHEGRQKWLILNAPMNRNGANS